jgi:hypothetical protein
MKCVTCNTQIPEARIRVLPNVRTCVNCSTESRWSAVPIIHHKTGNTIEVVKDPEVAKEFHRLSSRAGYGSMRGMRAGSSADSKISGGFGSTAFVGDRTAFERVGERALDMYELLGRERAERIVNDAVRSRIISDGQGVKIMKLIDHLNTPEPVEAKPAPKPKYNPYSKYEPRVPNPEVSEDIQYIFRNWKR